MRRILFFFSILSISFGALAQIQEIDSLKRQLPLANREEKLVILNELSFLLREVEQKVAFEYAQEAEKLAQSLKNTYEEARAKENLGWIYYRRGQWQKSFSYSKDAYKLAIDGNNLEEAARVLNSMGALYYEQQNYSFAIIQFKKAFEISESVGDVYTMIRSLNNVAENFLKLNELDSALFYTSKASEANRTAGSPYLLSFSNRIIGDVYFARNQLDSAEIIYEKALENGVNQGISTIEASLSYRLGNTYLLNGKQENAKEVLLKGIEVSIYHGLIDELSKNHKYLAEYYRQTGDYQLAYEQQSKFVALNDSMVNKSSRDRLALMQGMFQDDLEQSEMDLLLAQNENQATRLALNRKIIFLVSTGSILILGLMIWLFYLNRKIKKSNADLLMQKQKIHKQNEDLEVKSHQLQKINQTKNKLFSIIGHDLRGPVGQVKSIVDSLISGHLTQEEFDELIHHLKVDVDSVYFALNNTLKWSLAQMEGFKLQKVNFNLTQLVDENIKLITPKLREKSLEIEYISAFTDVQVYADRDLMEVVVRNILNNAVKYSSPDSSIQFSIVMDNELITWCVQDYGLGMDEEQISAILSPDYVISDSKLGTKKEKGSGLGLQICKEFTRMNGGEIFITSQKGHGTQVCVKIPASKVLVSN
ncbi:Signal transduction histidine kinase [Algoriphagus locisalis]|uniref:histidine kinase n=1 Tax=Algoriphagus locisalis TaxID=305507 RepID=A0A1I7BBR1_9BACT|nr:tetratricopeptide repeat protein [Algoriphagus locisalis]SFT84635.1 Signal transduction histidine kinase [Algoriphagus locisalis]